MSLFCVEVRLVKATPTSEGVDDVNISAAVAARARQRLARFHEHLQVRRLRSQVPRCDQWVQVCSSKLASRAPRSTRSCAKPRTSSGCQLPRTSRSWNPTIRLWKQGRLFEEAPGCFRTEPAWRCGSMWLFRSRLRAESNVGAWQERGGVSAAAAAGLIIYLLTARGPNPRALVSIRTFWLQEDRTKKIHGKATSGCVFRVKAQRLAQQRTKVVLKIKSAKTNDHKSVVDIIPVYIFF